jgi:NTP pyrophosphatase (non-canonical NTP hydrolase)
MDKIQEAMSLLQEECAEVIVEVSKCRRFGLDSTHYKTGLQHSVMLETEVGDVLCLIDYLINNGVLNRDRLATAIENKKRKLEEWSTIYVKN